jgi:hypothetical protein
MAPRFHPRAAPAGPWAFYIRAWRPACGWLICALLLRALIVPIVQLIRYEPVEPLDWSALSMLAGALFIARSYERSRGFA